MPDTGAVPNNRFDFTGYTVEQLIQRFNADTGHNGWVTSRGLFLAALREAFLATGLDCSSFITSEGMSMARKVLLEGDRIVTIGPVGPGGRMILTGWRPTQ